MDDLTTFQRDTLYVIVSMGSPYGLAIKRGLQDYYGKEVNHGRLYPNLDTLVQKGLIEKEPRDQRTNEYSLTEHGKQAIASRREWENELLQNGNENQRASANGGSTSKKSSRERSPTSALLDDMEAENGKKNADADGNGNSSGGLF